MRTSTLPSSPVLPLNIFVEQAARFFTALLIFSGAFVLLEPGPYEILLPLCVLFWLGAGLKFDLRLGIYLMFAVMIFIGGMTSVLLFVPLKDGFIYMITTLFLACSGFIFASIIYSRPDWACRNINYFYICGAMLTGLGGIMGYFGIGPTEFLTKFGRAKGFFQDPNVYGAFLVYPVILLFTTMIRGEKRLRFVHLAIFGFISIALLVSFSRGAMAHLIFSIMVAAYACFITSENVRRRARIIVVCGAVALAGMTAIAGALSIPKVQEFAKERFSGTHSYDVGYEGRFGRHGRGFALALEKPFGIGLSNFAKRFTEDPHNTPLKMLMDYGWLGFVGYICIVGITFRMALAIVLRSHAYKDTAIAAVATYLGLTGLSMIIDINHWRHFWLLTGVIWGLYLVTLPQLKKQRARSLAV